MPQSEAYAAADHSVCPLSPTPQDGHEWVIPVA